MPGNEVGDRVHNFFEQGNLSQDQRHTPLVEQSWPVFNNNLWGGNERQIGGSLNSSSKNYGAQQSEIERGQGNQFPQGAQGLNFIQPNSRPEFVKSPSQVQQLNLNEFMHSSQVVPTRQNEANFLGMDTEPDRRNFTSRGMSVFESQQRSGSQNTNMASFGGSESPMNFNFLGGQQQISGQQQGMLQSFHRQQSSINDAQLLQQQVMMKQMQEQLQRQQQLQQLEAMQRNAASQMSTFPGQMAGQQSPAINGNPLHDASNYPWQSQVAGNANWGQRGLPSTVQGFSNGQMITPEQGQAMRFMGMIPQQAPQSLYGVPVSNSRTTNAYSQSNINKSGGFQVPAPGGSFSGNQYVPLPEQFSTQDGAATSRSGSEGRSYLEHASSQGLRNVANAGSVNQVQQRNAPTSEGGRQDSVGGSGLLPEKPVTPATSSQTAVALDPDEEKILFGNDNNIWEAFGGPSLTGAVNRFDSSDVFNALPSVQSGSWSALMQSAVAETSSGDAGVQEEWGGLGSQTSRSQSGNQRPQPSVFNDNEKQQPVWVDSSQRAPLGSRTGTNDGSTGNYFNNPVLQQQQFANEIGEGLQTESQILQKGRNWLDHDQLKSHAVQNRAVGNANSSGDCSKTSTGYWSHQQRTPLPDNNGRPSSRPSALNLMESVPSNGGAASTSQDNLHDDVSNRDMCFDAGHEAAMRLESVPNSNFNMGRPQVNSMNDAVYHGSGQKLPDNSNFELWKPVGSLRSGIDGSDKDHHNLNRGPPILESSTTSRDGGAAEMHETENGDRRENSNDSHRSSIPHHTPAGGIRENLWSDAGDRHSLAGGREKLSGQAGTKVPVTRKFQYHPMGDVDVDVESSYAAKQVFQGQPMSQHLSSVVKGHETQPRFFGPSSTNSTDIEKGRVPSFQEAVKTPHGFHPGYFSNPTMSTPFPKSGEIFSGNQHASTSQNMLELLHKVDQSKEQNVLTHFSSPDSNRLSGVSSGTPGQLDQSHSSTSHGFSLQLAPPSQGIAPSNLHVASQNSSRPETPSSGQEASEKEDKAHAWLASVSSTQSLPLSQLPSQIQLGNNKSCIPGGVDADDSVHNLRGKLSAPLSSGSYLRSPLQNPNMTVTGGKMITDHSASQDRGAPIQSFNNSHHNLASGKSVNQSGMRAFMNQMPFSMPFGTPGISRMGNLPPFGGNQWTSQQQLLGAQVRASDSLKSQDPSNDVSETSSFTQQMKDEQDGMKRVDASSSQGIVGVDEPLVAEAQSTGKTVGASQEEQIGRHPSDASPSNSAVSHKDVECLRSNNVTQQSYSLQHQTQAMKTTVNDPSHRETKRLKGPGNSPDPQEIAGKEAQPVSGVLNNVVRDPSISRSPVSAEDAKMLSFSPQPGNRNSSVPVPHGAVASQDMFSFGRSDPQKFATANAASRVEHAGISPQMAPSWFQQYGTFKNGQLLSVHNVPRIPVTKNVEQQFVSGKTPNKLVGHSSAPFVSPVADTGQIAITCETTGAFTATEHVSSLGALVPNVSTPSLASMRPKKRKTATSDLLPWNKEVEQGLKRLQNMSSAEIDWAQSSNRLVEKVDDETANEDLLPMIRLKRRLMLTTQLMQLVFQAPSAAILSLNASSNYEIILYSLARLGLGDVCSLVRCMQGDSPVHLGGGNLLSEKVKSSDRIRDQYFSKVMEDFSNRAKELENDLLRLDKRASILDFRLECQDIERISVINRFARFHGRGQVDGSETSSSSENAMTSMAQKPAPQRYVSAHPMPRTVPERVQCLSL